jgi:hypothetical protein
MYLGSFNSATSHYDLIRDLTTEEIEQYTKLKPFITEARNRLALFRMLERNYAEWRGYLARLLSVTFKEDVEVSEELNRLLLNYLTFAYSIQKHFELSFRQRFKKQPAKLREYAEFLDRLCKDSWAFAFVLDYRGYVQHVGLGIFRSSRTVSERSIAIEIFANPKVLVSQRPREWKRSRLTSECNEINLKPVLEEFHFEMLNRYAAFVATSFLPELQLASEFYGNLTKEVQKRHPTARMIFYSEKPQVTRGEGGKIFKTTKEILVPNNVFEELGIKIRKKPNPATGVHSWENLRHPDA